MINPDGVQASVVKKSQAVMTCLCFSMNDFHISFLNEIDIREGLFRGFEATVTLVHEWRLKIRDFVGMDALLTVLGRNHKEYGPRHGPVYERDGYRPPSLQKRCRLR